MTGSQARRFVTWVAAMTVLSSTWLACSEDAGVVMEPGTDSGANDDSAKAEAGSGDDAGNDTGSPFCGDGVVNGAVGAEDCDNGAANSDFAACSSTCRSTNLILWLDASDPKGDGSAIADDTKVAAWIDKAAGRAVIQNTAARQPSYRTAGIGGMPSFHFDGADDFFDVDLNINEFFLASALGGGGNAIFSGTFSDGSFNLILRAMMNNGSAKILAEPNLVTLSGQPATFLSGGEFAVPTVVGVGGAQAATTSFKGFGTSIAFTPTVVDKDRIRLQVSPTFSTLNRDNAVNGIFGLDTRGVTTTVDMREGQVLAIAGLLQEQQNGTIRRIPFLGDIPGLGVLFSDKSMSRDETELIVLVSPELVHALDPEHAPQILPGMEVTEPTDKDFFYYGDIEGHPNCHHRGTVWPLYRSRLKRAGYDDMKSIEMSQQFYLDGPFGFSQ